MNSVTLPNLVTLTHTKHFYIYPLDNKPAGEILRQGYDSLKMDKWLSAGTALGLYRDKDFIKGDTDIDVEAIGYEGIDDDIKKQIPFELVRTAYYNSKPMQMAFQHKEVIFDIYIFWGDEMWNMSEPGEMILPKKFIENKEEIETKYGKFLFPSPIEDYLKYRYGDWQTPSNKKGLYGCDF